VQAGPKREMSVGREGAEPADDSGRCPFPWQGHGRAGAEGREGPGGGARIPLISAVAAWACACARGGARSRRGGRRPAAASGVSEVS